MIGNQLGKSELLHTVLTVMMVAGTKARVAYISKMGIVRATGCQWAQK